ncbi:MAG: aspartate/glutamate racemase family protein, partial [Christensenella sp.]
MEKQKLPIGIYDSGVGGVSVLAEAMKCLPHENFLYYGDSANAPYGTKAEEQIKELSLACGDFLYAQGVKMIVIACNTATSITVQAMREKYNVPIIEDGFNEELQHLSDHISPIAAVGGKENGVIYIGSL